MHESGFDYKLNKLKLAVRLADYGTDFNKIGSFAGYVVLSYLSFRWLGFRSSFPYAFTGFLIFDTHKSCISYAEKNEKAYDRALE